MSTGGELVGAVGMLGVPACQGVFGLRIGQVVKRPRAGRPFPIAPQVGTASKSSRNSAELTFTRRVSSGLPIAGGNYRLNPGGPGPRAIARRTRVR